MNKKWLKNDYQNLSAAVVKKLKLKEYFDPSKKIYVGKNEYNIWLHEDYEKVSKLALEHEVSISHRTFEARPFIRGQMCNGFDEDYSNHKGDKILTEIVAILQAIKYFA